MQKGSPDYFIGDVWMEPLFEAAEPGRAVGSRVTFAPGARNSWHTHP
jgi:quercetin dioxygenase-like cupin family protein